MSLITARIDVTKLDKSRLYKGEKGTYLNVILIPTPGGEYGDWMIKEDMTKEEREGGLQLPILGNAKEIHPKGQAPQQRPQTAMQQARESDYMVHPDDEKDEIPF